MEGQLRELLPFLHDRNPQVRQIALSNLLGQTPRDAPHRTIFLGSGGMGGLKNTSENEVLKDLKLLCRDQLATAHDAFRALVNLSDSPLSHSSLVEQNFFAFLVSYILEPSATCADLAAMILSNISGSASAASALITLTVPVIPTDDNGYYPTLARCATAVTPNPYPTGQPIQVRALPLLVDAFVDGANTARVRKGELHFLASVLANLSTTPSGRTIFLTPYHTDPIRETGNLEYPLAKCVVFTEHPDMIRRGGTASLIKNCAFQSAAHQAILTSDKELVSVPPSEQRAPGIDALPHILLPLAGPEEFDLDDQELLPPALQFLPDTKKREPDPVLRLTHVETLLLLCTSRWGRDCLRRNGVYEVVRATHLEEKVDKISEHIERLVNLLKGEEAAEVKEIKDEIDEDDIIEEI